MSEQQLEQVANELANWAQSAGEWLATRSSDDYRRIDNDQLSYKVCGRANEILQEQGSSIHIRIARVTVVYNNAPRSIDEYATHRSYDAQGWSKNGGKAFIVGKPGKYNAIYISEAEHRKTYNNRIV